TEVILARPGTLEVPARDLFTFAVEKDHGTVLPLEVALDGLAMPLVEFAVVGASPAQRNVAELGLSGELSECRVLASLAVLDDIRRRIEPGCLVEGRPGDAVDLDQEVEIEERILDLAGVRHGDCPRARLTLGHFGPALPDPDADDDELGRIR